MGDLDAWTVNAVAGESIVVRMGEVTGGSTLTPWLRIYSPTGALLDSSFSTVAAEVAVTAGVSGTFLVVAGDVTSSFSGSGAYRLTLAKTGTWVAVSPGDEGGPLPNGVTTGVIDVCDLDVWMLFANVGDHLVVTMDEVTIGSSLTPWLRIYGPSGTLLGSSFGSATAQVSVTAASSGTFLVAAGDTTSSFSGSGAYKLTTSGATGSPPPILDVDASNTATKYDALTDGLLVIRYLFDLTGPSLTTGALGGTATRTDPAAIKTYLDAVRPALDIDGNGTVEASTDGVLILRYLFGLRGDSLIAGAFDPLAPGATAPAIEAYIQTLIP